MKWKLAVRFSFVNRYRYFVFMTAPKIPVLNKSVVKNEVKPMFLCLIILDNYFSQGAKTGTFYQYQTCLQGSVTGYVCGLRLFTSR
jgi:hypothetical protein